MTNRRFYLSDDERPESPKPENHEPAPIKIRGEATRELWLEREGDGISLMVDGVETAWLDRYHRPHLSRPSDNLSDPDGWGGNNDHHEGGRRGRDWARELVASGGEDAVCSLLTAMGADGPSDLAALGFLDGVRQWWEKRRYEQDAA